MNIYKIEFLHASPKDREEGIKCLLLAKNDEQVYEWIKSEPKIGERHLYNGWADLEGENEEFEVYNDNYDVIGKDKEENVVEGNITIKDKYGNGKLTDSNGKTFVVTVEWIEYGKLLAKDEKENEYILLVK